MEINVTFEDIEKGHPEATDRCPIALAIKRQCPEFTYVRVGGNMISLAIGPKPIIEVIAPPEIYYFTHNFDNAMKVEPFSFILNLADLKERA